MSIAESLPLDETGHVVTCDEVHEVVLRVRYRVDAGDDVFDSDEWAARLRLAGLATEEVLVVEPSHVVRVVA